MYHTTGSRYEETKDLDLTEIAKLVRKDLKELFSNLPQAKASVRVQRYAGGQSLNIEVSGTGVERHGEEAKEIVKSIRAITDQYNFDDSDGMSDYFHVRFYSHPRIES